MEKIRRKVDRKTVETRTSIEPLVEALVRTPKNGEVIRQKKLELKYNLKNFSKVFFIAAKKLPCSKKILYQEISYQDSLSKDSSY